MRSGPSSKKKNNKKKAREPIVNFTEGPSIQMDGMQMINFIKQFMQHAPEDRFVHRNDLARAQLEMNNEMFHLMTDSAYGNDRDPNQNIVNAGVITQLSDAVHNDVGHQHATRPMFLKEPEPSPEAHEQITFLREMLRLDKSIKFSVTIATAACDELIKIPLNMPQTEIFLTFLQKNNYSVLVLNGKDAPVYFMLSMRQVESLKARKKDWIIFSLPFTQARVTLAAKFDLKFTKKKLIVLEKAKEMVDGKEIAMLELPLDTFPNQRCLENFVQLYDMLTKHKHAISLRVFNNKINVIPNTSELNLQQFSFVSIVGKNRPFYQLNFADVESCDDAKLTAIEQAITEAQQHETVIRKFAALRTNYGDRFMPAMSNAEVVKLSLTEFSEREAVLIAEDEQAQQRQDVLKENIEILKSMLLDEFARGKEWVVSNTSACIQPLSIPGRALLDLIKIDGMRFHEVNKDIKAEIDTADLQKIETAVMLEKSKHAKWLGTNINNVDMMICNVCNDPKNRFTEAGIEFAFRNNTVRDKFLELMKPHITVTDHQNGLYSISYAACNVAVLSAVLPELRGTLNEFINPKQIQNDNNKPQYVVGGSKPSGSKKNKGKKKGQDKSNDKGQPASDATKKPAHAATANAKSSAAVSRSAVQAQAPKVAAVQAVAPVLLPPVHLDRETLLAVANASVQYHDFLMPEKPAAKPVMQQHAEVELEMNNPHKGAILTELNNLEQSDQWYANKPDEEARRVTHHYGIELALLRLMNALDLRHKEDPALEEISINDNEAADMRSAIIHGLPTLACLMNISGKLRNECKLKEVYASILSCKLRTVAKSKLADCMKLFQYVTEDPFTVFNQTYKDLEILMSFYASKSNDEETLIQIKRAIKGCVVKIGEHSKIAHQLFNESKISDTLWNVIQECRDYRNTCSHNNINSNDFDPLSFEDAYKAAAAGLTEWQRINHKDEPGISNTNHQ